MQTERIATFVGTTCRVQ